MASATVSKQGSSYGREETLEARWSIENLQYIRTLWNLSDEHYQELCRLKDQLSDIDHWKNSPYEVVRFVTGPQGPQAEEMFRAMIKWRLENEVDTILESYKPPKILLDYIPSAVLAGYDREGDPIYLERGGSIDGYGLLTRYGKEKLMKHIIWTRESVSRGRWIEDYERTMGRPPTRMTIIYDLKGLGSRHMKAGVLPFFTQSLAITQQRYNGLAKRFIILRAPPIFNFMWGVCKHAFPKGAVKKMVLTGPHNYMEVLDKYVDRNLLPPCIYPEGKGEVAIGMPARLEGGLIPEDDCYYLEDSLDPIKDTVDSGDDSSTSFETDCDSSGGSSGDSLGRSTQMRLRKVRCKRILEGRWAKKASSPEVLHVVCSGMDK
jgi:CRAL/TRIO domain